MALMQAAEGKLKVRFVFIVALGALGVSSG